jgi:Cu-processing system permease protein
MSKVLAIAQIVLKESLRRKDFYVLLILTFLLCLILASLTFFNEKGIVRYFQEFCLLLIWLSTLVIGMVISARQIPIEKQSRTIFPLLAKPISRSQVLIGKFFGCWTSIGLCLLVFYFILAALTYWRDDHMNLGIYLQAYVLQLGFLAITIAMTILGSIVFAAPSSNLTILLIAISGLFFLGPHLAKMAVRLVEPSQSILLGIYYVVPHLEFFDIRDLIVHDHPPISWGIILLAMLYATAYSVVFLMAGCLIFRKQPLAKGN